MKKKEPRKQESAVEELDEFFDLCEIISDAVPAGTSGYKFYRAAEMIIAGVISQSHNVDRTLLAVLETIGKDITDLVKTIIDHHVAKQEPQAG